MSESVGSSAPNAAVGRPPQQLLRNLLAHCGCTVEFPLLPRMRVRRLFFEDHGADLLFPAGYSAKDSALATFVPLVRSNVALVRLREDTAAPQSVVDLLADPSWRGAAPLGLRYGDDYEQLVRELQTRKRLDMVLSPLTALRMVLARRVRFALLAPSVVWGDLVAWNPQAGAALELNRLDGLRGVLLGVYLSHQRLPASLHQRLVRVFEQSRTDGRLRSLISELFPPAVAERDFEYTGLVLPAIGASR